MDRFYQRAKEIIKSEQSAVMLGDYNVILQEEDAANPEAWLDDALFDYQSRNRLWRILNLGFTDALRVLHPNDSLFTFWDYQSGSWQKNNGIRIDHILLSPSAADLLESCDVDSYLRGEEKPSDHAPIWIELSMPGHLGKL
jgi:exodeoxyribonuclease-3